MTALVFWILVGLLLAAAAVLVGLPLWRGVGSTGPRQADANIASYRKQLAELRQEHKDGALDERAYEAARVELEQRLLDDVGPAQGGGSEQAEDQSSAPRRRRLPWAALLTVLALPVMTIAIYQQVGMKPAYVEALLANPNEMPEAMFRDAMQSLRDQLRDDPSNDQAWQMLGRGYMHMDDLDRAAEALERARELRGGDPELLTELAQVLAMRQPDQSLQGEPRELLERALEADADYPDALWLSGLAAAEAGDLATTETRLERLLVLVEGSPEEEQVRRAIGEVRERRRSQSDGAAGGVMPRE
ncbi:MAG: c-type cytochrome biogenesis protein CcmI [Aquisalimonadaceae bacterium]